MITATLDGVWTPVWQIFKLDDAQAIRCGHKSTDLEAAPHGTYVPMQVYRVQSTDSKDGKIENEIIDIFDAQGNFARFRWNEADNRWDSSNEKVTYTIQAGTYGDDKVLPELTLDRWPTLTIAAYTKADAPHPDYIGKFHTTSLGDPSKQVDLPAQSLDYRASAENLEWKLEPWESDRPILVMSEGFPPLDPERAKPGHNLGDPFGKVFVAQSKLDQVSVSFCGFNPTQTHGFASKELYNAASLGTKVQNTKVQNPSQLFQGALLFGFPKYDSFDYVQVTYIEGSPNVPAGIWPEPVDVEEDDTHTEFVSSTTDLARAHSITYGFSAGVGDMLGLKGSLTYSGKTDTQNKDQSRFTVTRKVAKVWAAHLDLPSLVLHKRYMNAIADRTYELLADPTPNERHSVPWDQSFVPSWGTHYANTVTHGSLTLAQTWFSLQAEQVAIENGVKYSVDANATVEGVKAGVDLTEDQSRKWQKGLEFSVEDVSHFGMGTPDPISIFLDLRPASELFGPIFVPYDEKDPWGRFAPWVWTKVRASFEGWLTKNGLNRPVEPDLVKDFRPRRFLITFPSIVVLGQAPEKSDEQPSGILKATGTISIGPVPVPTTPPSTAPAIDPRQSKVMNVLNTGFADVTIHPDPYRPLANALGCTIATPAGNVNAGTKGGLCFTLSYDIKVTEVAKVTERSGFEHVYVTLDRAHFASSGATVNIPFQPAGAVALETAALEATLESQLAAGESANAVPDIQLPAATYLINVRQGIYTLQISIAAWDAGPFQD